MCNAPTPPGPDFIVQNHGSLFVVEAQHDDAFSFLLDATGPETQYWGGGVVVEPRYVGGFVASLISDGWLVQ